MASLHLVNSNLPSTVPRNFENIMNFIPEKAIGCILYVECLRSWFHATLALTQNGCEYSSVLAACCFGVCCIVFEHYNFCSFAALFLSIYPDKSSYVLLCTFPFCITYVRLRNEEGRREEANPMKDWAGMAYKCHDVKSTSTNNKCPSESN